MENGRQYPSDLTSRQWRIIQPYLPKWRGRGRRPICRRRVLNAILYVARTGCQWRQLPRDCPHWKTVFNIYREWRNNGAWEHLHARLREKVRKAVGKQPTPSVAIIDSQSIRTSEGSEYRGYDAGQKLTGRQRHIAVDTLGLMWAVVVHSANWQDQEGGHLVAHSLRSCQRIKVLFGDSADGRSGLPEWIKETFGWVLQTVLRPVGVAGFVVLPKRWIVERTFAWLARYRRYSKDYEKTAVSAEAFVLIAMINLMSRRLAKL